MNENNKKEMDLVMELIDELSERTSLSKELLYKIVIEHLYNENNNYKILMMT